ncbi:energy transducer TonB [Flavobacterium sp.]|uniref:energy transducer TonB n=1 Tax=Flavobacterium sp. TaxID=239 RepID=UPI0037C00647
MQGKVLVTFVIEKDGSISIDKVRGPDPILEEEAKRIILLLPQMTHGYFMEDPVRVTMSIPISFSLN